MQLLQFASVDAIVDYVAVNDKMLLMISHYIRHQSVQIALEIYIHSKGVGKSISAIHIGHTHANIKNFTFCFLDHVHNTM